MRSRLVATMSGVAILAVAFLLFRFLKDVDVSQSDTVSQAVWLTLAVVLLLTVLLAIAVVLRLMNREGETTALGLPDGSISAVIALALLVLFALSSAYVYSSVLSGEREGVVSTGLDLADVRALPADRVIQIQREPSSTPVTYTVTLSRAQASSAEIGRTTLGTISTLLVAIVGFYFGQRASEKGLSTGIRVVRQRLGDGAPGPNQHAGGNGSDDQST